jgi:uncharacterized membrane protein HdeD (DUF308 family)
MENILESTHNEVKHWWWFGVMGLISLAAGVAVLARPAEAYVGLSIVFAWVMVASGVSQIIFSISTSSVVRGWGWGLVSGILDVAIGTYLLMYPAVTMLTLPYFVGFYLVFRSFYLMGTSFDLKSLGVPGWGWLLAGGILLMALGFLTLYYPTVGAAGIIAASGSAFLVNGILNFVLAIQLRALST